MYLFNVQTIANEYPTYRNIGNTTIKTLMMYGNCYMKLERFEKNRKDFERLFGEDNLTYNVNDTDLILYVNDKGKEECIKRLEAMKNNLKKAERN